MGKSVTVLPQVTDLLLPAVLTVPVPLNSQTQQINSVAGYSSGAVVILTDAEYAALPASTLRCLSASSNVAEPVRASADPKASTITVQPLKTGTVPLALGYNVVGPITGPVTLSLTAVAWSPGTRSIVTAQVTQDATGSRVVTQPSGVKWAGGSAPVTTVTASKTDLFEYSSTDGGATVFGRVVSANS